MRVTLAQGSGGEETARLINEIFSRHLGNEYLNCAEDSAIIELSGKLAFSTDSFVVTPLEFSGGDIGALAICGTANDLVMMGAEPKFMTLGVIIEQGMEYSELSRIAESIGIWARKAGVSIVAADTKVVDGAGGLYLNTSGIGIIRNGCETRADGCLPGDRILVSGSLGNHHACILSARMGIENNIKSDLALLAEPVRALFDAGIHPHAMRDITRGGFATVINELASASGCGAEIFEDRLPADEDTRALCDLLGLDPLYMGNEGTFALVVSPEDAPRALDVLKRFRLTAADIGEICSDKQVYVRTRFGGMRALPPLRGEGLPRIC